MKHRIRNFLGDLIGALALFSALYLALVCAYAIW